MKTFCKSEFFFILRHHQATSFQDSFGGIVQDRCSVDQFYITWRDIAKCLKPSCNVFSAALLSFEIPSVMNVAVPSKINNLNFGLSLKGKDGKKIWQEEKNGAG